MRKKTREFVGIDVSKARVDVHFHPTGTSTWSSTEPCQLELLAVVLVLRGVERVVMESTGGYSTRVRDVLVALGVTTFVVQPQRIRHFAKALGVQAKTDRLDAKVIAMYGAMAELVEQPAPSPAVREARELVIRRQQLVEVRTAEKTRREHMPESVLQGSRELIELLDRLIDDTEKALAEVVQRDAELARRAEALTAIKGIGKVVAWTLLALVPELGTCSPKTIAALVGLAPFNVDSGQSRGRRRIRGGRKRVRAALYMAARTAARCAGPLRDAYERLKAAGKLDKVAITAVMRKLLVIANAKIRDALASPGQGLQRAA